MVKLMVLSFAFSHTASAADWYVATNGTGNGTNNWANATNSIQGAINASFAGDTVWVSNGVYDTDLTVTPGYALTNRVMITNAITVRSANNDPTNTIIKGAGPLGDNAVRCVFLTNGASLIGFTLTNGYVMTNGNNFYDGSGGGVLLFTNAVVSNCVISGNMATNFGGGACLYKGGTMNNCTLSGNTATYGGGMYCTNAGTLNNCTLSGNSAASLGGGAYFERGGLLNNCTLSGNRAGNGGGAYFSYGGYMYYSTLSGNTGTAVSAGGGITALSSAGTLRNCLISGNRATTGTGGGYLAGGTLYNCVFSGNTGIYGGGIRCVFGGKLYNCTLSGNTSSGSGGGMYNAGGGGSLVNCIVWGNNAADTSSNIYITASATLSNSCSGPVQTGAGNIGSDPQFVDTNTANYRLNNNSPCINAGTNGNWTTNAVDLDGHRRIIYGTVDMGAYERINEGTIYGFR